MSHKITEAKEKNIFLMSFISNLKCKNGQTKKYQKIKKPLVKMHYKIKNISSLKSFKKNKIIK